MLNMHADPLGPAPTTPPTDPIAGLAQEAASLAASLGAAEPAVPAGADDVPAPASARGPRNRRGPGGRPNYHHGDLRRALVDAALRLVEAGDEVSPTLRSVAEAVGVSAAAPYRHFADREALLAAVLVRGFDELAETMNHERLAAGSPLEALAATGEAYVRFAAEHPRLYRTMFGPECDKTAHPDLASAGQRALAVMRDAVTACCVAGHVDAQSAGKVVLASWSLMHGLASLQADGLLDAAGGGKAAVRNAGEVIALLVAGAASTRRPMGAVAGGLGGAMAAPAMAGPAPHAPAGTDGPR